MPKPSSTAAPGTASHEDARHTEYEGYEVVEVHRSQLKNASYNPRQISDKARRKLKEGIKKLKLLGPVNWNARTGNIVGGHQRVAALDALEGTSDYRLLVARCDLDEVQEKEANVLLNNPETQGDWDLEKLEAIFKDDRVDVENTGFDLADVYKMFGDAPLAARDGMLDELSAKLREARSRYDDVVKTSGNRDGADFYCVVVFKDDDDRTQFLTELGIEDNRYVDGRELRRLFKVRSAS